MDSPRRDDEDQTVLTIARSWLTMARSSLTIAKSRRRVECPISIRRLSLNEIVDRVMGHDPFGFASSDNVDFIMEQTADDRRAEIPLKTEQIRFNPHNLKPHSCGSRVSSEIRSIIKR